MTTPDPDELVRVTGVFDPFYGRVHLRSCEAGHHCVVCGELLDDHCLNELYTMRRCAGLAVPWSKTPLWCALCYAVTRALEPQERQP